MPYRLFLDDEREPIGSDWLIARSYEEAVEIVSVHGFPNFVSFDHDLGERSPGVLSPNGLKLAKFLVELDLDYRHGIGWVCMPPDFGYVVHSQNPEGAKDITLYLARYLETRGDDPSGR